MDNHEEWVIHMKALEENVADTLAYLEACLVTDAEPDAALIIELLQGECDA